MDEPFSAVDPIARERLQAEFLAPAGVGAQDDRVRHPRHRGGGADRRPDRGDEPGRPRRAVRHPGRAAGARRRTPSSPTSSAPTAASSGWRSPASTPPTSSSRRWCTWPTGSPTPAPRWTGAGARWAVVLDDRGAPARLAVGRPRGRRAAPWARPHRRMEAWVPADASLKYGVRHHAAARGRLGRGAGRRPLPRRPHPGVAARGPAPLGRGRRCRRPPARSEARRAVVPWARPAGVVVRRAAPGTRYSSHRAGGDQRRGETTPMTAATASLRARLGTAGRRGPTCASTPAQRPATDRADVGARLRQDGQAGDQHRLHRPHQRDRRPRLSLGRARPGPRARRSAGPAACGRRAPRRRRAPASGSRQPPVQRRQVAVDQPARRQPGRDGDARDRGRRGRAAGPGCMQDAPSGATAATSPGRQRRRGGRPTRPCPGSTARRVEASSHGTSTKARSCARGCGRVSAGSSETTGAPSSPVTATTSTSSVRGPQRTSRVRPAACSSSCARASHPAASRSPRTTSDRVEERRLLDRPPRRRSRRAVDRATSPSPQRGRSRCGACRRGRPGWRPAESTARVMAEPAPDRHGDVVEGHARGRRSGLCTVISHGVDQRVGEADVGQPLREGLEQVHRLAGRATACSRWASSA